MRYVEFGKKVHFSPHLNYTVINGPIDVSRDVRI